MDLMEVMKERHSVRQYTDRPIETEKLVLKRHGSGLSCNNSHESAEVLF